MSVSVIFSLLIATAPLAATLQTPPASTSNPRIVTSGPARLAGNLPQFPNDARQRGIGGVVTLDLTIDKTGKVNNVKAVRSIPMLEAAAVEAVRAWRYPAAVATATVVFQFDAATGQVFEARRIGPQGPQPKKTKNVAPTYPAALGDKGGSGQAIFDIVVNSAGKVIDMQLRKATSGFESAAREAIRQWEYEPLMVDGRAVPFVASVTLIINRGR